MDTHESEQGPVQGARNAIARARTNASEAIGHVPGIAGRTRDRAGQVAERLPGAFRRARSGAQSTVTGLQRMPDSGLGMLAAASVGFGAGLRLAGAPRLATLAGWAPASIFGFAIWSRPGRTHPAPQKP